MRTRGIALVALTAGFVLVAQLAAFASTAAWEMDETSGTTMTGSGGPNGTISGDVTLGVSGHTNGAYAFNTTVGNCDGSGNITGTGHVVIPSNSVFSPGSSDFSFSVWVNTTAVPGTGSCDFDVFRRGASYKIEMLPYRTTKAKPLCQWKGTLAGTHLSAKVQVNDGKWHQITCQRTASGEALLVDGVSLATTSVNVGSIVSSAQVLVASKSSNADFYVGLLDDLSFQVG
jgi:hypothetical protein